MLHVCKHIIYIYIYIYTYNVYIHKISYTIYINIIYNRAIELFSYRCQTALSFIF